VPNRRFGHVDVVGDSKFSHVLTGRGKKGALGARQGGGKGALGPGKGAKKGAVYSEQGTSKDGSSLFRTKGLRSKLKINHMMEIQNLCFFLTH
jgi:hypothetical protein